MTTGTFTGDPIAFAEAGRSVVQYPGSVPMALVFSFSDFAGKSYPVRVVERLVDQMYLLFVQTDAAATPGAGTVTDGTNEWPWDVQSPAYAVEVLETQVKVADYIEARV